MTDDLVETISPTSESATLLPPPTVEGIDTALDDLRVLGELLEHLVSAVTLMKMRLAPENEGKGEEEAVGNGLAA